MAKREDGEEKIATRPDWTGRAISIDVEDFELSWERAATHILAAEKEGETFEGDAYAAYTVLQKAHPDLYPVKMPKCLVRAFKDPRFHEYLELRRQEVALRALPIAMEVENRLKHLLGGALMEIEHRILAAPEFIKTGDLTQIAKLSLDGIVRVNKEIRTAAGEEKKTSGPVLINIELGSLGRLTPERRMAVIDAVAREKIEAKFDE